MGNAVRILVIGCGSIGERHIRNLRELSVDRLIACDIDSERLNFIKNRYCVSEAYTDLLKALKQRPDAVVICTPPSTHTLIALKAVDHNAHVFIEKPMSNSLAGLNKLVRNAEKGGLVLFVGYNFRFHQGLRLVKNIIDKGEIGRILYGRAEFGQYLPDWRPWQDYRRSYTAKKDLGGGIILDGSHEIDYMRWLLGDATEVFCFAAKAGNLEVETEDIAEIFLKFKNGATCEIHLDFIRRDYSRTCEIVGEKGTVRWDYRNRFVKIFSAGKKRWKTLNIKSDYNDMYMREMRSFLCLCRGNIKTNPPVDGKEGRKTLEMALAAKKSAKSGRKIRL